MVKGKENEITINQTRHYMRAGMDAMRQLTLNNIRVCYSANKIEVEV